MEKLSRRSLLIGMSTVALANATSSFAAAPSESLLFIGVYTDQGSKSKGVYAYRLNTSSGDLSPLGLSAATDNPSFLAISPDKTLLYAANEIDTYKGAKTGAVSAFKLQGQSGKLTPLNVVASGGSGPCNINLDHTGKAVLVADYTGGSAATFQVQDGGNLSEAVSDIHYSGHGPNTERQATPHGHCATATPDNRHVLINDLGLDCIHIYKFDAATAKLTPNDPPAYHAKPDSGPRSLVFHPNGRYAYSTNELSNTVDVLAWDASAGTLTRTQNVPTAVHPEDTNNTVASVVIDRDGRNLYVSNRGPENSIVHFSIDHANGQLKFVARVDSGGKVPRHFALDPTEHWLVVAHQVSHNLVVFKRNPAIGSLTPTDKTYPIDFPTCVLFA